MSHVVSRKLNFIAALVPGQRRPGKARVVDENIKRPVRLQERIGETIDGTRAGEIERERFRPLDFWPDWSWLS